MLSRPLMQYRLPPGMGKNLENLSQECLHRAYSKNRARRWTSMTPILTS
jgi:hypothetical protein